MIEAVRGFYGGKLRAAQNQHPREILSARFSAAEPQVADEVLFEGRDLVEFDHAHALRQAIQCRGHAGLKNERSSAQGGVADQIHPLRKHVGKQPDGNRAVGIEVQTS